MKALASLAIAAGIAVCAAPAGAQVSALACGDVVTTNVTLQASLRGCSTGLVIGADGITVNLNGYSIEGIGEGVGVEASDRSGVSVRNGRIRGFATGVSFFNTTGSTIAGLRVRDTGRGISIGSVRPDQPDANEVAGNTVTNSDTGIFAFGSGDDIVSNTILSVSGAGILCRGAGISLTSPVNRVTNNLVARSGVGISLLFCVADVSRNTVMANAVDGILRTDSLGLVAANSAIGNGGSGIASVDSHGLFSRNVTIGNGGDGLSISDTFASHGPFYELVGNLAIANGGYGINTSLEGVVDNGRNRAYANRGPSQCVGVACN